MPGTTYRRGHLIRTVALVLLVLMAAASLALSWHTARSLGPVGKLATNAHRELDRSDVRAALLDVICSPDRPVPVRVGYCASVGR